MKYLKTLESLSDLEEFNIDRSEIIYYFTDILDEGFNIKVDVVSKLIDLKISNPLSDKKLGKINYIRLEVSKGSKEISELKTTLIDLFKETIEIANNRLNEIGLYIKEYIMFGNRITILIYKKEDEKYIK
jgi:hypothetical protein